MRILKYDIPYAGSFEHVMPEGAQILCVQPQANEPKMWVMVDDSVGKGIGEEKRTFQIFVTGRTFSLPALYRYVGTFQLDGGVFVGHVFEIFNRGKKE